MENLKLRKLLLLGRYGEKRYLQEVEPCIFKLTGEDLDYMQIVFSEDNKSIYAVDPTGGPFISVGSFIKDGIYIKSIVFNVENGDVFIYTEN